MEPYDHKKLPTATSGSTCPHCGKPLGYFSPSLNLRRMPDGSCFWNCRSCGGLLHENPETYVFGVPPDRAATAAEVIHAGQECGPA